MKKYIDIFLEHLDELEIGSRIDIPEEALKTYIEADQRPSSLGTTALTYSYIVKGLGIPLEVRINQSLDYSKIIIKTHEQLPGYSPFVTDPFGNVVQEKDLKLSTKDQVREELERLSEYLSV